MAERQGVRGVVTYVPESPVERQGVRRDFPTVEAERAHFRAAQIEEWDQFVATQDIFYNGVPAYRKGDPVPASNVKTHGYLENGLVERRQPVVDTGEAPEEGE